MKRSILALTAGMMLATTPVLAQDTFDAELKARQGQMRILSLNLGLLGSMAKGEMEYDAAIAQAAAGSLSAMASGVYRLPMWPEGSDNAAIEGTRALPAIWENYAGFESDWTDLATAAGAMQAAAAAGPAEIGGAMRQVGAACQACHEDFRQSQN